METAIDLSAINKIYFIGIGGIGTSAVARYLLSQGKQVLGSDLKPSNVTERLEKSGVIINYGQRAENITPDIDLAVYTASIPASNPELQAVHAQGIPAITYGQSLGLIFNGKRGIAICGTHGKSTTSALVGAVLEDGGVDPSVFVGSIVPRYDSNLRVGSGEHFVAEACEYSRNFMSLYPRTIILNNVELDHTDCYKDIEEMKSAFLDFVRHLPEDGLLLVGEDANARAVAEQFQREKPGVRVVRFGAGEDNDFYLRDFRTASGRTSFEVRHGDDSLGEFSLRIPGKFNAKNALAAVALGTLMGLPLDKMRASLESFSGIWRRFEIKGEYKGALVISDYAHHPTAVRVTIEAAKEFYPGRRLLAVFQPHQHNRTRGLYQEFTKCFAAADELILMKIYDVAGREEAEDQVVSSEQLARDVAAGNEKLAGHVAYASTLEETRRLIDEKVAAGDVILIMGAGDIFQVADQLVAQA